MDNFDEILKDVKIKEVLKEEMKMYFFDEITMDEWVLRIFHRFYNGKRKPTEKDAEDLVFSFGVIAGVCDRLYEGGVKNGTEKRTI